MLVRGIVFSLRCSCSLLRCRWRPIRCRQPTVESHPKPRWATGPGIYRLHAQLNTLLGDLAGLQVKYRAADEDKRAEIQQQWKE